MNNKSERALREEKILQFWQENKIFEKSLEKDSPKGEFVFYDGPPFATGLPHAGSLLSSVTKDVIPRYKTMRGYHVRRRWGWDCHGLPIENMIEKELGIKDKTEIEGKIGIKAFNEACRASVLRYARDWKNYIDRVGRWVEYDNAYKTMDNSYIESVWHALKVINEKGLLYEGQKVLLYCPHCQTPIAKAEIAMDNSYKDVTEESVYVKFKIVGFPDAYFLVWTTTPWTLPGNVALAVGKDIVYVEVKVGEEILVLAKDRLSIITEPYEIIAEHKGSEMVGMSYEPLYSVVGNDDKAFKIYLGDFVNTEEGTGIVHTAVLYGEDDYQLGLREDLPMAPLLDAAGHFNEKAPEFIHGQYFKKAEKMIKEDLEKRKLLFKKENYIHSYPHCHRCGTALLYNAISSWFLNIQKVKDRMIKLNEKINWVPGHLKHGRFLNIVENAPDWTISRNRYWASPLPIWKDVEGKIFVLGSLDEFQSMVKKSGNKYFLMRHGEAGHNVKNILDLTGDPNNHLTEKGRKQIKEAKLDGIDLVFSSPFLRSRETAEIVTKNFVQNDLLREMSPDEDKGSMKRRILEFIFKIEKEYKNKTILIISHRGPLATITDKLLNTGEITEFKFTPYPHNDNFELDLHRPYIDEVELVSENGQLLKRVPEVLDGWVESASMPFAEYHYPFENKKVFESRFPGDFIAEYIAQTRTWFYYMHAIAAILFDDVAFKNVLSTGNVLAEDGSKMSKSKGNYTDPLTLLDRVCADAFRFYLMSSVVMQSEDMLFKDEEVKEVHNRLINILANSVTFYELYANPNLSSKLPKSTHVLDLWVISCLHSLIKEVTEAMDIYDMVRATKPVREFVTDLSTWYIRRSRDRFKAVDNKDKTSALSTTKYVFKELAKLIAPIMPFIAEEIYQKVKNNDGVLSVHLEEWPKGGKIDEKVLESMEKTRKIVSTALEARSKANIKVRQPLGELKIKNSELGEEFIELVRDELNVKKVTVDKNLSVEIELDLQITPELEEEGRLRDVIRSIQELRKEKGLKPSDKMAYEVPYQEKDFFTKHTDEIKRITNIDF